MKRGCTLLAGTAGARWGCGSTARNGLNEFRFLMRPWDAPRTTSRVIGGAAMRRNYSERVKVDYYYGHEKFKKGEEEPPAQQAETDDQPRTRVKGAKLSGVQGGAKTRRWYKQVSVGEREGGWAPLLDGRVILTPMEHPLVVPSQHNALMIAAEWEMQQPYIKPDTMPITRLATTVMDRLVEGKPEIRHALTLEILDYIETDTICYRPDDREKEQVLYDKQQAQLRPFLKWFSAYFNMDLMLHFSVIPEAQPEETINGLRLLLHNTTDWELGCLDTLVSRTKSLVLGLALWKGPFSVDECILASRIEEDHNIAEWGECEGAHDLDKVDIYKHVAAATAFLRSLPPEQSSLQKD